MQGVNKVILVGNVGRDPEIRYTSTGTCIANLSLATNESYRDKQGEKKDRVEWHRCVAFGKLGEVCAEYVSKGDPLYIEGRLQTKKWEDKNGDKHQATQVSVVTLVMLGGQEKKEGAEQEESYPEESQEQQYEGNESIPF